MKELGPEAEGGPDLEPFRPELGSLVERTRVVNIRCSVPIIQNFMPWRKGNRLKLVAENEASGRTLEIYSEIKQTLGVPQVNAIFQAFAVYPKFLDLFWQAMQPVAETQQFFHLGNRLRAEAYTRAHNYFLVPDLCSSAPAQRLSTEAQQALSETVDMFHYLDPLLLLLAVALMQAFEKPVGQPHRESVPAEHPIFLYRPALMGEESAPLQTKAVYEDMKRTLDVPVLSTAYQAFARFPAFLESYWSVLKPATQSALYALSHTGIRESAWCLLDEFPARVDLTLDQLSAAGVSDDEITAVVRITEIFVEALSRLVVNVALAKIGLEGGNTHMVAPWASSEDHAKGEPKQAA